MSPADFNSIDKEHLPPEGVLFLARRRQTDITYPAVVLDGRLMIFEMFAGENPSWEFRQWPEAEQQQPPLATQDVAVLENVLLSLQAIKNSVRKQTKNTTHRQLSNVCAVIEKALTE